MINEFFEYLNREYSNISTKRNHVSALKSIILYCLGNQHVADTENRKTNLEKINELVTFKISSIQKELKLSMGKDSNTPQPKKKEVEKKTPAKKRKVKPEVVEEKDEESDEEKKLIFEKIMALEHVIEKQQMEINHIRNHYIILENFILDKLSQSNPTAQQMYQTQNIPNNPNPNKMTSSPPHNPNPSKNSPNQNN